MSPAGTARVLFAVDENPFLQSLFAITNPKKMNSAFVFRRRSRTFTGTLRLRLLSRWLTTPLKQNCDNK
jgi:hypothetical protein